MYNKLPTGDLVDADDVNAACDTALSDWGKTGFALSAAAIDAIHDEEVEANLTLREFCRLASAVLFGKSTGGGGSTLYFRDVGDTANRVTATVDSNGNRTAMVLLDT